MEYNSVVTSSVVLIHALAWRNLENILLGSVKEISHKRSHICMTAFSVHDYHFQVVQWLSNPPASTEDAKRWGFDPWIGKIPWIGNGNPFQYSCLENSMDRGAWQATVHGVAKSWTWLSSRHVNMSTVQEMARINKSIVDRK